MQLDQRDRVLSKTWPLVTFVQAEQDAALLALTTGADLTGDFTLLDAQERQSQLSNLVVNFAPTVDIGPWAAHEAVIADALYDQTQEEADTAYDALIDQADAAHDRVLSEAAAAALWENVTTTAAAVRDLALATADWTRVSAEELADNALATLGLSAPDLPVQPELEDFSPLPKFTSPSHSHDFKPNDSTREPYAALAIGMFDYLHSNPALQWILDGQYPKQLTTDRLLESVIHTDDPTQDDAAARMLINREHGIRSSNAREVISDIGISTVTHDRETGEFTVEVTPHVAQPLAQPKPYSASPKAPLANVLSGANNQQTLATSKGSVDVETKEASPATLAPVYQGTAKASPQREVSTEDMQVLVDAGYVTVVTRPAESAWEQADRMHYYQTDSFWYKNFWRDDIATNIKYKNLFSYGSFSRPEQQVAVLRIAQGSGWVNYVYKLIPEATETENVSAPAGAYGAWPTTRTYAVPAHWALVSVKGSSDYYTPDMMAEIDVWDKDDIGTAEIAADLLEVPLYFIPGVGTALDYSKGDYVGGTISLVGDLALGIGAVGKGLKAVRLLKVATALEATAIVGQSALTLKDLSEGEGIHAATNAAPILMQVLGLRAAKRDIKALGSNVPASSAIKGLNSVEFKPVDAALENFVAPKGGLVARIQAKLDLYPKIIDPRTGRNINFPNEIKQRVPKADRVIWTGQGRNNFIKEWHDRGYVTPRGGWDKYDIHHIRPREFGGTNDFWNLVPVEKNNHKLFNNFWREFLEL